MIEENKYIVRLFVPKTTTKEYEKKVIIPIIFWFLSTIVFFFIWIIFEKPLLGLIYILDFISFIPLLKYVLKEKKKAINCDSIKEITFNVKNGILFADKKAFIVYKNNKENRLYVVDAEYIAASYVKEGVSQAVGMQNYFLRGYIDEKEVNGFTGFLLKNNVSICNEKPQIDIDKFVDVANLYDISTNFKVYYTIFDKLICLLSLLLLIGTILYVLFNLSFFRALLFIIMAMSILIIFIPKSSRLFKYFSIKNDLVMVSKLFGSMENINIVNSQIKIKGFEVYRRGVYNYYCTITIKDGKDSYDVNNDMTNYDKFVIYLVKMYKEGYIKLSKDSLNKMSGVIIKFIISNH